MNTSNSEYFLLRLVFEPQTASLSAGNLSGQPLMQSCPMLKSEPLRFPNHLKFMPTRWFEVGMRRESPEAGIKWICSRSRRSKVFERRFPLMLIMDRTSKETATRTQDRPTRPCTGHAPTGQARNATESRYTKGCKTRRQCQCKVTRKATCSVAWTQG